MISIKRGSALPAIAYILALFPRLHKQTAAKLRLLVVARRGEPGGVDADDPAGVVAHEARVHHRVVIHPLQCHHLDQLGGRRVLLLLQLLMVRLMACHRAVVVLQ